MLLEHAEAGATAVLNLDDPHVIAMAAGFSGRVLTFGCSPGATLRAEDVRSPWPQRLSFTLRFGDRSFPVHTRLCGRHWVGSVLAALGVAVAMGVPLERAIAALAAVSPTPGRMSPVALGGVTFVCDHIKAPLWTMASVFEFLADSQAARKIAVIGTISDYPGASSRVYRRVAEAALSVADEVLFVGPNARKALKARRDRQGPPLHAFDALPEAADASIDLAGGRPGCRQGLRPRPDKLDRLVSGYTATTESTRARSRDAGVSLYLAPISCASRRVPLQNSDRRMRTERILVADAETRGSLARGSRLAPGWVPVAAAAAASARPVPAHWSRSVNERFLVPDPLEDEAGFVNAIERVLSGGGYRCSFPAAMRRCSRSRGLVTGSRRTFALGCRPATVSNGASTSWRWSRRRHVTGWMRRSRCVPGQNRSRVGCGGDRLSGDRRSRSARCSRWTAPRGGSAPCWRATGARSRARSPHWGLVPRAAARARRGAVLCRGVRRRTDAGKSALARYSRTWLPDAGGASFSQTIEVPPRLEERVRSLLEDLGWEGLFELELIERGDGAYAAIDLNPRSLRLARARDRRRREPPGDLVRVPAWSRPRAGAGAERSALPVRGRGHQSRVVAGEAWETRGRRAGSPSATRRRALAFESGDPGPFFARLLFLARTRRFRAEPLPGLRSVGPDHQVAALQARTSRRPTPVQSSPAVERVQRRQ